MGNQRKSIQFRCNFCTRSCSKSDFAIKLCSAMEETPAKKQKTMNADGADSPKKLSREDLLWMELASDEKGHFGSMKSYLQYRNAALQAMERLDDGEDPWEDHYSCSQVEGEAVEDAMKEYARRAEEMEQHKEKEQKVD